MRYVWLALLPLLACAGVRQWDNPGWENPVEVIIESSSDGQSWTVAACQPDGQALSVTVPDASYYRSRAIERGPNATGDCDVANAAAISEHSNVFANVAELLPYSAVTVAPVLPWTIPDEPEPPVMTAPAIVQSRMAGVEGSASVVLAYNSSVTAGNWLVAFTNSWDDADNNTVTDSQGNTWTRRAFVDVGEGGAAEGPAVWTTTAGSTGANTVTLNGTSGDWMRLVIVEVSGADSTFDVTPAASSGTSSAPSANIANITQTDVLVMGGAMFGGSNATLGSAGGWTNLHTESDYDNREVLSVIYRVSTGAGALDPAWTLSASRLWGAVGIAFAPGAGGSVELVVQDASHGHSTDAVALTQANTLALADTAHGHTVEAPTLSISFLLAVADALHSHGVDNTALTQANVLVLADTAHGHSADAVALVQANVLAVADTLHGHSVDNAVLTEAAQLAVASALHGHSVEGVALAQASTLVVADSQHTHTADGLILTQANVLVIADTAHSNSADNVVLSTGILLSVADAAHAHTADNVALVQANQLVIADALHGHAVDALALSQSGQLSVTDTAHSHTADALTLAQQNVLVVADADHSHTVDAPTLTVAAALIVADANHTHSADSTNLTQANVLEIADALHAHSTGSLDLDQLILTVADTLHAHSVTGLRVYLIATNAPSRTVRMLADNRNIRLLADNRTVRLAPDNRTTRLH